MVILIGLIITIDMKWHFSWLVVVLIIGCTKPEPRKIEVLFLGHNSLHHNSEKYLPILAASLANQGINFTYTATPSDLNERNLSKFDALMIYANHDSITDEQERALLDFVDGGKGFLPIHCASYCFRNSEAYIDLVGAQFKSHGTGVFEAQVINSDHPITAEYDSFESWDETYVSHRHNPDRTVLMERVDSTGQEPWTWVRSHGKGRVFYTASGHDERTWRNPGFQELLRRAIVWSVGDEVKNMWQGLELPDHQYVVSENIANYEKRPAPLKLQQPFSQPESQKLIQVPAGFRIEVVAEEPDIVNPMFINWDHRGRLWVVESVDYPNEVNPDAVGRDRIKICEDTDGDGKADKFTIFADSLNIPTSFVFSDGGIIVSAAPNFLYLKDTDGDDRADFKQVLFGGWGTFDTHAGPSNLKYGFDNYIWGTVGYSAFQGMVAGKRLKFGQGLYRFNPELTDFEYVTSTSNNTWGLGFSETFDVFASTANNAHSWYLGIPDRYFNSVQGIPGTGSKKIAGYYAFHPITENIRQVDVFGGFTAAAGHNVYTARQFPSEYWNSMAFICEPTGNLLAQGKLVKDGAGFVLEDRWNLMASSDEWVSPVHAEVGPDGAVWVADWYNFIIQHNPTPTPLRGGYQAETGDGNAHVNPLRDRSYGRIYRIISNHRNTDPYPQIDQDRAESCLAALNNSNLFWRLTAQRLLVESGNTEVIPGLLELIRDESIDEMGLNPAAVHALWTLHGLGAFDDAQSEAYETAVNALRHPSAGVRKAAIQVLPKIEQTTKEAINSDIINDSDPHTLLAVLLGVSELPENQELGSKLYELSIQPKIVEDFWLSQALFIAAAKHQAGFRQAYQDDPQAVAYEIAAENKTEGPPSVWNKWDSPREVTSDWPSLMGGQAWENDQLAEFDGRVLVYKEFDLHTIPDTAFLHLGRIGQSDRGFVNGTMLHETRNDPEKLRAYSIPVSALRKGMNYIIVTIEDQKGPGGLLGPENEMYLDLGDRQISIAGEWKYFVQEKKSRGINYSEFFPGEPLGARFIAYNSEEALRQIGQPDDYRDPNAIKIQLSAVRNELTFDKKELTVPAGESVEIEFVNADLMQHNLLISTPGSLTAVGAAADALAQSPDGQERQYIPSIPQVLYATPLINPGGSYVLRFTAPEEPGEYLFICTFPGHWQTMNGVLKVEGPVN